MARPPSAPAVDPCAPVLAAHEDGRPALTGDPRDVRCVDSLELLGAKRELLIRHDGRIYRLRITRQNKLLLAI